MDKVNWGILGCGDVAEVKSGPAFNKVPNSKLLAVMRRDGAKAQDFAERHGVPFWYDSAERLLENREINAVYIATPPSTHVELALKAMDAGKNIYLEKPMALSTAEGELLLQGLRKSGVKLTMAHYRRRLPAFLKVKELLDEGAIGEVRLADIQVMQPGSADLIAKAEVNWRLNPKISGGGYFHDLAPHHLDLMLYFFGNPKQPKGWAANANSANAAPDLVSGICTFGENVHFRGVWCFGESVKTNRDYCEIYGSRGSIEFSFFGDVVKLKTGEKVETFSFDPLPHVQLPQISATVDYLLNNSDNPCSAEEGLKVMKLLDTFGNSKNI